MPRTLTFVLALLLPGAAAVATDLPGVKSRGVLRVLAHEPRAEATVP